jgi:hypothetical protein
MSGNSLLRASLAVTDPTSGLLSLASLWYRNPVPLRPPAPSPRSLLLGEGLRRSRPHRLPRDALPARSGGPVEDNEAGARDRQARLESPHGMGNLVARDGNGQPKASEACGLTRTNETRNWLDPSLLLVFLFRFASFGAARNLWEA